MKIDKNFLGIIVLLAVVGGLSATLFLRPVNDFSSMDIARFPKEIGDWKAKDIPLDERTYTVLETKNVVMREYRNPRGEKVYLYIVYSDVNRRVSHPPEVCYTGGGIDISEKEHARFSVPGFGKELRVNSFVSGKDGQKSLVYYWYKAGDKFTTHYLTQQIKAGLNQLMGKKSSTALIRISTEISTKIDNQNKEKAAQILQGFSRKFAPLVKEYLP